MALYVRFESKEDLEWLQRLIDKAVLKLRTNPSEFTSDYTENILRIHDALHSAAPVEDAHLLGVDSKEIADEKEKVAAAKAAKKNTKSTKSTKTVDPNLCSKHPKNKLERAPRTDCDGCWGVYKKLHPLDYDIKRRAFERKMTA